ncbi:MAG: hypothetical protein K1W13_04780 [Lachnospiraceae bacterium]
MAIYKCKMCGGALEIHNKESVATCEYCGTQQTLRFTGLWYFAVMGLNT